jgi:hypothetical protein
MDTYEVGEWRYCPACGRTIYRGMFDEIRCSCCKREWDACPCTPASEGECRSVVSH